MTEFKICAVSDLHLSTNPRLWKEANSLALAGYKIVIITVWTSSKTREKDLKFINHPNIEYKAGINLIPGEVNPWKRLYYRLRRRLTYELKKYLGIESLWSITYSPRTMLNIVLNENADLYIAHSETGILIGSLLIKKGKKVAFDIEDWYSNDYLVSSRPIKLLKHYEEFSLVKGIYSTCPSQAMANALQEIYSLKKKSVVIYNGFSVNENKTVDIESFNLMPSLVWFSQTIGHGRGLESIITALEKLDIPVQLNLIGDCVSEYDKELTAIFPFSLGHQLQIHRAVPHTELITLLPKFDIGLAVENNYPPNKNKTISNKILQYLQAGLKVLATNTDGQIEVANHFPDTIKLIDANNQILWAERLKLLISSPAVNRFAIFAKFNEVFSWEAQEIKLLKLVYKALHE